MREIDVDLLSDLIIDNLLLFKLDDKTLDKFNKPFSLKNWINSNLIPCQKFPYKISITNDYEVLVNDYFIKHFKESSDAIYNNTPSQSKKNKAIITFKKNPTEK